jgi:rRNA maturation protein Rpf1
MEKRAEEEEPIVDEDLTELLSLIKEREEGVEEVPEVLPLFPDVQQTLVKDLDQLIENFVRQGEENIKKLSEARKKLEEVGLIKKLEYKGKAGIIVGVDGANTRPKFLMGAYISAVSAIFYPASEKIKTKGAGKTLIIPPIEPRAADRYTQEYRMFLELTVALEGLKQGNVDILFMDGSLTPVYWYRYVKHAVVETEQLKPTFSDLYITSFKGDKSLHFQLLEQNDAVVVGMPKRSVSKTLIKTHLVGLGLSPLWLTDRQVCSLILKAGEYIAPMPYKEAVTHPEWLSPIVEAGKKDKDSPSIWSEKALVTYFKPSSAAPAVRVEFLRKHEKELPKILFAIQRDFNVNRATLNVINMADSFSRGIWATPDYIWEILRTETTKRAQAEKKSDLLDFMEYGFQEIE